MGELIAILDASREREQRHNQFAAALKGIKLDAGVDDRFQQVALRAEAARRNVSEDEIALDKIGIKLEEE